MITTGLISRTQRIQFVVDNPRLRFQTYAGIDITASFRDLIGSQELKLPQFPIIQRLITLALDDRPIGHFA
jgi:hypothetical protein